MQQTQTIKPPILDRVQRFLIDQKRPIRKLIAVSVFLTLCNAMLMICGAWVLSVIIASILFDGVALSSLYPALFGLIGIYILRGLLTYGADRAAFFAAMRVKDRVRHDIAQSIFLMPAQGRNSQQSGSIMNSYVEGVEALHGFYMQSLPARMTAVVVPVAVFLCIVPHDWVSGLILLVTAPLIPVFMIWIGRGAERLSQRQWRRMTYMGGRFFDLVQGLPTLKLFNAAEREGNAIRALGEKFRQDTMAVLRLAFLSSLAMEFFATVSIALIAVIIGFRLLWGEMEFVHGFFILLLAPEFYIPLRRMGATYHAKMEAIGAAENIAAIIQASPMSEPNRRSIDFKIQEIAFQNVCFSYDSDQPIIKDANFSLRPGDRVALIGESGQGKSTILRLILGLITPQQGKILVNGYSLDELDLESWRCLIGWVGQSPHLFQGSVLDNIRIANGHLSNPQIQSLLDQCGIGPLAEQVLGENGTGISGGQAHRVALARALARSETVLLLDEPSAYLDEGSEELTRKAIEAVSRDSIVLFATHKAQSLTMANQIIRLEKGVVSPVIVGGSE